MATLSQGILFEGISNIWHTEQQVSSLPPKPVAYGKHCAEFPAFQKPKKPLDKKNPFHILCIAEKWGRCLNGSR